MYYTIRQLRLRLKSRGEKRVTITNQSPALSPTGATNASLERMLNGILRVVHSYHPAQQPNSEEWTGLGILTHLVRLRILRYPLSQRSWQRLAYIIEDMVGGSMPCLIGDDEIIIKWSYGNQTIGNGSVKWRFVLATQKTTVSWKMEAGQVHDKVCTIIDGLGGQHIPF
jgi:hypothetical protein